MELPLEPDNERERIQALKDSRLLDSDKEAVFDNLTSLIKQVFDVPVVAISLIDKNQQWFKSIQGLDISATSREVSFCGHVVYQGKPLVVTNAHEDPRFYDNPLVSEEPGIAFYAGVPIRYAYRGKTYHIGTICIIDRVPRSFSADELSTLKKFAFQLEALIEMRLPAMKFEQLTKQLTKDSIELMDVENSIRNLHSLSETDLLTDLPNRRYLNRLVKEGWFNDSRQKSICLMMLDLDNFKTVNDLQGHYAGDNVLKSIAFGLNSLLRINEDHICRLGGDEFVLVTYNQDEAGIEAVANKILQYFSEIPEKPVFKGVTFSIGGCVTSNRSHSLDDLLKQADEQLYKAKKDGKNCFVYEELD